MESNGKNQQKSGYRHPQCYANVDANCSKKISREHFISESLLRRINLADTATIAGLSWQPPRTFKTIAINSLVAKILCTHHNNVLSLLDRAIESFTRAIRQFDQEPFHENQTVELSRSRVERWMLKCLLGLSASKNITAGLKPECASLLLGIVPWPPMWGLYFESDRGPVYHTDSMLIQTLTTPHKIALAARFHLQGLPFKICLGQPDHPERFGVWRPTALVFRSAGFEKKILISWDDANSGRPVFLDRAGTYKGPPPIWEDWQKNP